jgi:hypothetical protein
MTSELPMPRTVKTREPFSAVYESAAKAQNWAIDV